MYKRVEVSSNVRIDFIVFSITIILDWSLAESSDPFWCPEEFENVANPYFDHLKHLQNPGHLSLTATSMWCLVCHHFGGFFHFYGTILLVLGGWVLTAIYLLARFTPFPLNYSLVKVPLLVASLLP